VRDDDREPMAAEQLLLDFAVILIAAEIGGALFRRIRLPRAVGMLVAVILLGPFTPGYVIQPSAASRGLQFGRRTDKTI
jgi:Kef-type K+ transport system membrane component KefB